MNPLLWNQCEPLGAEAGNGVLTRPFHESDLLKLSFCFEWAMEFGGSFPKAPLKTMLKMQQRFFL